MNNNKNNIFSNVSKQTSISNKDHLMKRNSIATSLYNNDNAFKYNQTENLSYLNSRNMHQHHPEQDNVTININYEIDEKKRKKDARMSLGGGKVSFANTVEVRLFEKTNNNQKPNRRSSLKPTSPFSSSNSNNSNSNNEDDRGPFQPSTTTTTQKEPESKVIEQQQQVKEQVKEKEKESFFQNEQEEDEGMAQDTMDFTATYGKIFLPYIKDEIQPLNADEEDDNYEYEDEEEEDQEEQQDESLFDVSDVSYVDGAEQDADMKIPSLDSVFDELDQVYGRKERHSVGGKYKIPTDQDDLNHSCFGDMSMVSDKSRLSVSSNEELELMERQDNEYYQQQVQEQEEDEQEEEQEEEQDSSFISAINSPHGKKKKISLSPKKPTLSSLLDDEEYEQMDNDDNEHHNQGSPSSRASLYPSSPVPQSLLELANSEEDDLTNGDIRDMIDKFQVASNLTSRLEEVATSNNRNSDDEQDRFDEDEEEQDNFFENENEDEEDYDDKHGLNTMDKSRLFHIKNGTHGSGGRLSELIKQDDLDFDDQDYNPHVQDMTMTQSLGKLLLNINNVNNTNNLHLLNSLKERDAEDMSITQSIGHVLSSHSEKMEQQHDIWDKACADITHNLRDLVKDNMTTNFKDIKSTTTTTSNTTAARRRSSIRQSLLSRTLLDKFAKEDQDNTNSGIINVVNNNTTTITTTKSSIWDKASSDITHNLNDLIQENQTGRMNFQDNSSIMQGDDDDVQDMTMTNCFGGVLSNINHNNNQSSISSSSDFDSSVCSSNDTSSNIDALKSTNNNNTKSMAESMVTIAQDHSTFKKQYTQTPSYVYDNDDSLVYGKINFEKSIHNTQQKSSTKQTTTTGNKPILEPIIEKSSNTMDTIDRKILGNHTHTTTDMAFPKPNLMLEDLINPQAKQQQQSQPQQQVELPPNPSPSNTIKVISFNDFLYLANIRFLDDVSMKSKRSSLMGLNVANNDDYDQNASREKFEKYLINAYCHYRHYSVVKKGYDDLNEQIAKINEDNKIQENYLTANNPSIFQEIQVATKNDLLAKQHLLKKIKNMDKLKTQTTFYKWRNDLERFISNEMKNSIAELSSDCETMAERIQFMKNTQNQLLNDIQKLKANEKKLQQEYNIKSQGIKERASKLNTKDHDIVNLNNQVKDLQSISNQLVLLSNWIPIQITDQLILLEFKNKFTISLQKFNAQDGSVGSSTIAFLPSLPQTLMNALVKWGIESRVSSIANIKDISSVCQDISEVYSRIIVLFKEIEQLERLYNISIDAQSKPTYSFSSPSFATSTTSSITVIDIRVQLSNVETMKKIVLDLQIPIYYPKGRIEYAFSILSIVNTSNNNNTMINMINKTINDELFKNNNKKLKLSKLIQSLEVLVME
ncbi:hypothetical protein CYY_008435 [Polysphondylium violaceum]|uniref:Spc7 kinetochore protein domain-containing protein n=1 Tax=Polysphondylium violaceum TaxID=133409 RepID=A0A8J4PNJ3_9MYCE|nr:hypothetical protein CYY_008435 [Polysphondylium violaceum]